MLLHDKYGRIHDYLRISVTDKCNLNCIYCKPGNDKNNNPRSMYLSNEEIRRLVEIFITRFDFKKIRLTGGEPFLRHDLIGLLEGLLQIKQVKPFELSATTNGTHFNLSFEILKELGIDRLNFSLDTLNSESFIRITGQDRLESVLKNIDLARKNGFPNIKINTVIIRNINDHELLDFIEFGISYSVNIRFIEFMPFSNNGFRVKDMITSAEMKEIISERYKLIPISSGNGVAKDYHVGNEAVKVSFISSISDHFCGDCNRLRINAAGEMKLCLFSRKGSDLPLLPLLQSGLNDDEIAARIESYILNKDFKHPDLNELIELNNDKMFNIGG